MAIQTIYSAESWNKIYKAFDQVNFTSFDFNTIKQSLITYSQTYYAETFNDMIESSEFIQLIESFAYIAEQLSYRLDMLSHENFITTAQRKQSILRLAKLISYTPTRNIPARGHVKIVSVSTSQQTIDVNGNNLANQTIVWNDANNGNWKSQFFLILNQALTSPFGQYNHTVQINDITFQTYTFNNVPKSLTNGVYPFKVDTGLSSFPMEITSCDIDTNGPFEKTPDINSQLSLLYSTDGLGDSSDFTGFSMLIKQGALSRLSYSFTDYVPNRSLDLNLSNINDTDVWLTEVDTDGKIVSIWEQVQSLMDQNIAYNNNKTKKKFEVETLEGDKVRLIFGDGDYAQMPYGNFYIWVRQSANQSIVIQPNNITNQSLNFQYISSIGTTETLTVTFSLLSTIQNSAPSESIEHIRQSAPSTYYAQNRMVNAQDYNTFMLKDQSILRLNSINRTFAGQPKYIDWNDASGQYENIKLFGDDLQINQMVDINTITTGSTTSSRNLIDTIIEPLLSSNSIINLLNWINITNPITNGIISLPRRQFIQDNRAIYWSDPGLNDTPVRRNLLEKTEIQGAIDAHFYGEPITYTQINNLTYAVIKDPSIYPEYDGNIWSNIIPRTVDKINPYIPGDTGSGLQTSWQQNFGLCYNNHAPIIGTSLDFSCFSISRIYEDANNYAREVFTIEVAANGIDLYVSSSIRGALGIGKIGIVFSHLYSAMPIDFLFSQSSTSAFALKHGDVIKLEFDTIDKTIWDTFSTSIGNINNLYYAFQTDDNGIVIKTGNTIFAPLSTITTLNILGRWEIIDGIKLVGTDPNNQVNPNNLPFDPNLYLPDGSRNPNSWIIWVKNILNPVTQSTTNFVINFRELTTVISSANTKFWYNSDQVLLDSQTQNVVYDQIRILRSNLRPDGKPVGYNGIQSAVGKYVGKNEIYAVVGPIKDNNGIIDPHSLEVMAPDVLNVTPTTDTLPTDVFQFENFVDAGNNESFYFQYFQYNNGTPISGTETFTKPSGISFNNGSFVSNNTSGIKWGRKLVRTGIDFMWQHFTDYSNLIDPSTSNIHDTYIITSGYYQNMRAYLNGTSPYYPTPPTPLELRGSYGYLLGQKMLSDTVVLHSGKFKLLFGQQAEPQLRAAFYTVQAPTAKLSIESLKVEILNVINTYFSIENWDYGQTFYVTELTSLIHQRLPTEISTIVLVPTYAINSFGSLFMVQSGMDEVLMSCATINDIQVVAELNPTIMRQGKI